MIFKKRIYISGPRMGTNNQKSNRIVLKSNSKKKGKKIGR